MVESIALDRDERLAELLLTLDRQQGRGEVAEIDRIARGHPELESELRQLWATAQFAAAFAATPVCSPATEPAVPMEAIPAGRMIGDYELLEQLGSGGMGIVWKARQKSLKRLVALKMIRNPLASDMERERFRGEAAAAARLQHPGIVTVHEVGEWEGQPFFVMELVEGRTLAQQLRQNGRPTPREAARMIAEIAHAVAHAHEHGVLHRDLKPSNILIGSSSVHSGLSLDGLSSGEQIKIADFGLAKRLTISPESLPDLRTHTGEIVGTPSYMAPEQAGSRRELSPATDVYALGAILYELLTGRPPFLAANPVDTLLLLLEQEPLSPRFLDPGIDRDLEMICLKCLQKPPELRYQSASRLAADLESFLRGETLSSAPSGLKYFVARMLRETHHIGVLENWGELWIWHSLMTFLLCLVTQIMEWEGVAHHGAYLVLWSVGLITWGSILWQLRRRAGPVLFVERQLAHAWAAGVCASIGMFVIEVLTKQPVLTLSPAISIAAGMVFVFKAGILSGRFYLTAAAMFATSMMMVVLPDVRILLFGFAASLSFLIPGVRFFRLRQQRERRERLLMVG